MSLSQAENIFMHAREHQLYIVILITSMSAAHIRLSNVIEALNASIIGSVFLVKRPPHNRPPYTIRYKGSVKSRPIKVSMLTQAEFKADINTKY